MTMENIQQITYVINSGAHQFACKAVCVSLNLVLSPLSFLCSLVLFGSVFAVYFISTGYLEASNLMKLIVSNVDSVMLSMVCVVDELYVLCESILTI